MRKNCSTDREKLLKFEAEGREFFKIFEITRTIYSNSERSKQFLVTECCLTCSGRFFMSDELEQLEFKLEKILGFGNMQEKLEKHSVTKKCSDLLLFE